MKVTLEFSDDERSAAHLALNAGALLSALCEIDRALKSHLDHDAGEARDVMERCRGIAFDAITLTD